MTSFPTVIVTGAAGFIGYHFVQKACSGGFRVVGIDNVNDYYQKSLKESRLDALSKNKNFEFFQVDITDRSVLRQLFGDNPSSYVVHLAAQAGVRYSLTNPYAYLDSNLHGFLNILEACRHHSVKHLVYASSSSVYGANTKMPFSVHDNVDHPVSLYAATKKANELMAHSYSALYRIPTTGLRFFTVYGPFGRPDMALFIFTKAILEGKPIDVYNNGKMKRDFTFVDDIVEAIFRLIHRPPAPDKNWDSNAPDPSASFAPYKLYNIGNNNPVELMQLIEIIEKKLDRKAIKNFMPLQIGDVPETYADVDDLMADVGFKPSTSIEQGVGKFIDWYLDYYSVKI
jgi:UDP-glucuronate 4-epimerase